MKYLRIVAAFAAATALSACSVEWGRQSAPEDAKVSDLPVAHALDGTETVLGVQDGRSVQIPVEMLAHKE